MGKTIFITGGTELSKQLKDKFLSEGSKLAVTADKLAKQENLTEDSDKNLLTIPWNRESSLSTRNLILKTLNTYNTINEAMLILSLEKENRPFHLLSSTVIENKIDMQIKSSLFLLKEFLAYFQKQGKGALFIIIDANKQDILSPIDAAIYEYYKTLTKSLFIFYQNEPIILNGFDSSSSDITAYAEYIIKNINEKAGNIKGKWFRFSSNQNPFSSINFSGKRK